MLAQTNIGAGACVSRLSYRGGYSSPWTVVERNRRLAQEQRHDERVRLGSLTLLAHVRCSREHRLLADDARYRRLTRYRRPLHARRRTFLNDTKASLI